MKFVTLAAIVFSSVSTGLVAIAQVPAVTDNSDSTQVHKFPLLQFHIAEDEAAEGLVKAIITGTDQEVYLHRTAIVTEHHVSFARVVVDLNADPAIDIEFTQVGAEVDDNGLPVPGSGYLAPVVLKDQCVGCGLCQTRCNGINVKSKGLLSESAIIIEAGDGYEDRMMSGSYIELRQLETEQSTAAEGVAPTTDFYVPE